ncbi:MAG: hypothetical protein HN578_01405 [Rhodospirillales bacterium]|nr:hypothetical protein [Rhodospirillales bacterium]
MNQLTAIPHLDLSAEVSPSRLEEIITDGRAWTRDSIDPTDATFSFDAQARDDLLDLVKKCQGLRPDDLPTARLPDLSPSLKAFMAKVKASCDTGLRFAAVDRLELDGIDIDTATAVSWLLGRAVGRQVAQKWDGSMLYNVTDYGLKYEYGVRGSYTNVELVFHTDNAFAIAPPDYVSLLCLNAAKKGGVSRFCNLYSLHNLLLKNYPKALARLYQPLVFDRQAEHAADAPKVSYAPMFRWDGRRLTGRAHRGLIMKGYEIIGASMDTGTKDALSALEEATSSPDIWVEQHLERGQIQFLNNREVAHYRSTFEDHDDPTKKRHLIRSWHRDQGGVGYDG